MLRYLALALLVLPVAATAAERRVGVGSFDRVRIEGPFTVTLIAGRSPGAVLTGERAAIDAIEIRVDGTRLVVRAAQGRWGERPSAAPSPVAIALATPSLGDATVIGGGKLAIAGVRGTRLTLVVTGAGAIAAAGTETDQLEATVVGTGAMTLAGHAAHARLVSNGAGAIDASALDTGDLTVRLDGPGETRARARYTAQVTSTGAGRVTVTGTPKCTVAAPAGGVTCGTP